MNADIAVTVTALMHSPRVRGGAALLVPLGTRWMDTLGVVERAHSLAQLLPEAELDLLVARAYLHDVGYAPALAYTGFHPLDGAVFLRSLSRDRLACLVAHHSGARAEAEARGLARELDEFAEEQSRVADALTYCDLVTVSDVAARSLDADLGSPSGFGGVGAGRRGPRAGVSSR